MIAGNDTVPIFTRRGGGMSRVPFSVVAQLYSYASFSNLASAQEFYWPPSTGGLK